MGKGAPKDSKPKEKTKDLGKIWKQHVKGMKKKEKNRAIHKANREKRLQVPTDEEIREKEKKQEKTKEFKEALRTVRRRKWTYLTDIADKKKLSKRRYKDNRQARALIEEKKKKIEEYHKLLEDRKAAEEQQKKAEEERRRKGPQSTEKAVVVPAEAREVWVGGLDPKLTASKLQKWFAEKCGPVTKATVAPVTPERTLKSGGLTFGFVTFAGTDGVKKALAQNGTHFSPESRNRLKVTLKQARTAAPEVVDALKDLKKSILGDTCKPKAVDDDREELERELAEMKRLRNRKKRKKGDAEEDAPAPAPLEKKRKRWWTDYQPQKQEQEVYTKATTALSAGTFRMLNEMFCFSPSGDAKKFFELSPDMFHTYHEGYRSQVEKWPINPLDIVIDELKTYKKGYPPTDEEKAKKRKKNKGEGGEDEAEDEEHEDEEADNKAETEGGIPRYWQVCDLGCGDAKLAQALDRNKVLSYDLVANNERVTVADIAHTPAPSYSCEVVVMCLALLGTNWIEYLREAHRLLSNRGLLKIVELTSRIPSPELFCNLLQHLGFWRLRVERVNEFFWLFDFQKKKDPTKESKTIIQRMNPDEVLKPFVYKKR